MIAFFQLTDKISHVRVKYEINKDEEGRGSVWARIDHLRSRDGMSQRELSIRANRSPTTLSCIRSHGRVPSMDVLKSIADVYGVSLDYLIYGIESEEDGSLKRIIDRLSDRALASSDLRVLLSRLADASDSQIHAINLLLSSEDDV